MLPYRLDYIRFTEANPDKGTETGTEGTAHLGLYRHRLQKLTPIRGRKHITQSEYILNSSNVYRS